MLLLLLLLIIPALAILTVFYVNSSNPMLLVSFYLVNLVHTLVVMVLYKPTATTVQFRLSYGLGLGLGIDGISLWLVWLVNIVMALVILLKTEQILIVSVIGFWCIAVFIVLDLFMFYVSFEGVVIPMLFMIGWYGGGGNRKIHGGSILFVYTLFGSLFVLLALMIVYLETGTTDYQVLLIMTISVNRQVVVWLALFLSLAIKIPMVPFHLWLLSAHVQAPTGGSVMLAAILLKLGSYGLIRYTIPLLPEASRFFTPFVCSLSIIAIIYTSIACLAELDLKRVIAYSSIGHMNTSVIGMFSNDYHGITASIYFLISHGIISSALFLLIGVIYDRYHTRTMRYYRGLVQLMPVFTLLFFLFTLANAAVPGTSGFISEFLVFIGLYHLNPLVMFAAAVAIILTPCYALWLFHRVSYGSNSAYFANLFQDLTVKELHLFLPLGVFTLIFGLYPELILNYLHYPTLVVMGIILMALAVTLIYGLTGTTNYDNSSVSLVMLSSSSMLSLLLIVTLLWKLGAAPVHNWAPDLYDSLSFAVVLWMIIIPKLAVFGLIMQIPLITQMKMQTVFAIVGVITVLVGSIGVATQWRIVRFISYSAITHLGFLLLTVTTFHIVD